MKTDRIRLFAFALAAIALAALGMALGYWLYGEGRVALQTGAGQSAPATPRAARKPLYYQDPDGKPIYSATPKKTVDGRDFRPVYAADRGAGGAASASAETQAKGAGRILYYRNPMGLPDTSPVPKKDSMGMDYIPVYEGGDETGLVTVSPQRLQMLGVRTAPVELRSSLLHSIRATGTVQPDESKLAAVTTRFDGFVEKLFVSRTGDPVRAGQPLAQVWIDTPDTMMQRGPNVVTRQVDYIIARELNDAGAEAEAVRNLHQYGIPDSAIAEIRRTGHSVRSITIGAPIGGIVLDKPAVEGMRFETGAPLFKIADLSTVWVLADVQERDLGAIRRGQMARITFVAFPGRTFTGTVDFISPMLAAATRAGQVRIVMANRDLELRESMYATVDIEAPATSGGRILVVPDSAVMDSGTRQVVLVVRGQGLFEPRRVLIGARGDGAAQVLDGLTAGEQVVVGANFLIDAESNLRAALQSFAPGGSRSAGGQAAGGNP